MLFARSVAVVGACLALVVACARPTETLKATPPSESVASGAVASSRRAPSAPLLVVPKERGCPPGYELPSMSPEGLDCALLCATDAECGADALCAQGGRSRFCKRRAWPSTRASASGELADPIAVTLAAYPCPPSYLELATEGAYKRCGHRCTRDGECGPSASCASICRPTDR